MALPFTPSDLDDLAAILADAARGEILPRFARLDPADVRTKAHATDFVTVADEAAEAAIASAVARRFPGAAFVGEELMERDPGAIAAVTEAPLAIVVDPIDGTFNFANGIPAFAVIAAVIVRGAVTGGIIHDPLRGDHTMALAGGGAWLAGSRGRQSLAVAAPVALAAMHGAVSFAYTPEPRRSRLLRGLGSVWGGYNYRCGGQEMRLLAAGGCHFCLYEKLSPWDHAAGWLIHREAGGHSARLDGSPYRPEHRGGGLLMAPDAASWAALHEALVA